MSSPLTTHILDTARGTPAAGVPVQLEIQDGEGWRELAKGATNADGRVAGLVAEGGLSEAVYRITFETAAYFAATGVSGFYPYAQVVFQVTDPASHHHVPLLLSPFGYSTYRGS
jgi:5-hydroxyisourate hydrolase